MQPAILLVADEFAARDLLQGTLTEAGYSVTEVADGSAALDLLRLNLTASAHIGWSCCCSRRRPR
jgi:CheY-like chemotaxis protein